MHDLVGDGRQIGRAVDDAGRLAAQLQRGGRQVARGRLGHPAAHRRGPGEEQVVEGQRGKLGRHVGPPQEDGKLVGGKALVHQLRHQGRSVRRQFAGLEHDAVAGGQGHQRRPQRQLDRVIPWRDHAHHAQRLALDACLGRLQVDGRGHPLRLHPARQMAAQLTDHRAQHEQVGHLRQIRRPHPEVRLHRIAQCLGVVLDECAHALKPVPPDRQGNIHLEAAGLVLGVETGAQGEIGRGLAHGRMVRPGTDPG